tara:strand:+ start:170 stop:2011 length:1842 start_codon:yes stop_codon:yes gene_type:complete
MLKSIIPNKRNQIIILLINSLIFVFIYLYNQPIDFHCDSATFYNYGSIIAKNIYKLIPFIIIFTFILIIYFFRFSSQSKKTLSIILFFIICIIFLITISINAINTPFSIYAFDRPPLYPLFLFFSGTFFFDTFYPFIFFQTILSILTIYLIYSIFIHLTDNINYSFIVTLLYGITSIPYILIKFISAEQLMYFLVILTFYSIISFYKKKEFLFLYFGLLSSLLCWLTKWEGQLVFVAFISFFVLNFILSKNKRKFYKHIASMVSITIIILLSWTTIRSAVTKDFSTILNVSNSTMDQSMWRFYSSIPSSITIYEKALNIKKNNTGKFISDIYPGRPHGTIIIHSDNGKYSTKLFDLIKEVLQDDPLSYEKLKKPLSEADRSDAGKEIDFYYELFGKFNNITDLTNNMMNQPNIFYFNFWDPKLTNKIGRKQKDKLYQKVINESLINNPIIIVSFLNNMFTAYGIDFDNYILYKNNPYSSINDVDFLMPFNGGKCAENNLSDNHFKEYKNANNNYNKVLIYKKITEFNDSINDFIRNYFGIFIIIACFVLLFVNFTLFMPLIFIPTSLSLVVSVLVDSPTNSKYEVIIFSANYILLGYFIFFVFEKTLHLFNRN